MPLKHIRRAATPASPAATSSSYVIKRGLRSLAVERRYLLSFHQHSRFLPVSALFFMHIPGSSPTPHFRSFVFYIIPGYTFIFAITFPPRDSLHTGIDNQPDFRHLTFLKRPPHFYDSSLSYCIFINIPGSTSVFQCLLGGMPPRLMRPAHGRRRLPPAYCSRLIHSPGVLSREFSLTFLRVGKKFTKWPRHFLPVGKQGFRASVFQPTDRTLSPGRGPRERYRNARLPRPAGQDYLPGNSRTEGGKGGSASRN